MPAGIAQKRAPQRVDVAAAERVRVRPAVPDRRRHEAERCREQRPLARPRRRSRAVVRTSRYACCRQNAPSASTFRPRRQKPRGPGDVSGGDADVPSSSFASSASSRATPPDRRAVADERRHDERRDREDGDSHRPRDQDAERERATGTATSRNTSVFAVRAGVMPSPPGAAAASGGRAGGTSSTGRGASSLPVEARRG